MENTPPRPPRDYARRSQSDRLQAVESALHALATNDEIRAAMTPPGYGADGLAEGQALYEAVRTAGKTQASLKGRRLNQTASQDALADAAEDLYRPLAATARVVFDGQTDELAALGLTGEHGNSLAERLDRMRSFSLVAREPARLARLTGVGRSEKEFNDLDAALATAGTAASVQDHHAGTAQDASGSKKAAFARLDAWMKTMHGYARINLADRPDLQEPLGLRPR